MINPNDDKQKISIELVVDTKKMEEEFHLVSLVITTRNEEKHIANCLESIKAQTYPEAKIEIIVVDNKSTDRTKEIAMEYTDKVYNKGPERSAQRNFGVHQARGKYILYLDADMILSPDVIKECVVKCDKENVDALYIPEKITGEGFWIKVRNFERSFYNATPIDCVRFIKRDLFEEVGGFDESLTGPEDWDLDRRIRGGTKRKFDIINAPIYHNEADFNLVEYVKGKNYYIRDIDKYKRKWGAHDPIIKKQLGAYYRLFGVFFDNGKWKKLMRHPLLTIAMYYLRLRVGLAYLRDKTYYHRLPIIPYSPKYKNRDGR